MGNEIDNLLECRAVSIESPISISLISYVITLWAMRLVLPILLLHSYCLVALELGLKQAVPSRGFSWCHDGVGNDGCGRSWEKAWKMWYKGVWRRSGGRA